MPGFFKSVSLTGIDNEPFALKQVNNKLRVSNQPYLYDIAEGNVPGHRLFTLTGYASDVDDATVTIWPGNSVLPFPATPMQMELVSSNVADTAAGTGTRKVDIHYLDANRVEKSELVTLNGTTAVATVATNIARVCYVHTETAGSGGSNAGTISIRHISDTPVYDIIPIGYNQTISARCSVPANTTLYLTGLHMGSGSASGGRFTQIFLQATTNMFGDLLPGIFLNKGVFMVQDGGIFIDFTCPIKIPALADLKLSAVSDTGSANAFVSITLQGWMENESA